MGNKALLIANGTYPEESGLPSLKGPRYDIDKMRAALTHPEYGLFNEDEIICCPEYDQSRLARAIEDFLRGTSRDDFVLIYYSGHGLRPGSRLYFATSDTKEGSSASALSTAVIIDLLEELNRAERTMFILDCCYAGAFDKGGTATMLESSFPGEWVLCSSSATQTSKDGEEGEPSRFTKALTDALIDPALEGDEHGWLDLTSVFGHISKTLIPRPEIKVNASGPGIIARRPTLAGADHSLPYPELEMLREPDYVIPQEIDVTSRDALIIRNISALLDLAGQPQSTHHRETVDAVREFVGSMLLENGVTQESLLDVSRSLSNSRLTRLSLRIPDTAVDQLPWEYLEIGDSLQKIRRGPLALTRYLLIERRVEPDDPPSPPEDEIPVDEVMLIGTPTAEISVAAMEALWQDLGNLKIKVDPPEAGRGRTYGEISFLTKWPPVLVLLAGVRQVKDGRQAVQIQLAGPGEKGWIEAQEVHDIFQFSRKTFRAIIIESFTAEPGDGSQEATAELASSLARRGLGNVIFLCHPAGFSGYERHAAGPAPAMHTFAGHLIAALNAKATVPHAFYIARYRMQTAFYQRCGQTFGIPGLYIPEYAEKPSESSRLTGPSVSPRAERQAGPVSSQQPKDRRSSHRDDLKSPASESGSPA